MVGVLDLINPDFTSSKNEWKPEQQTELTTFALRTLSFLVPILTKEFIDNQGPTRTLLMISLYQSKPYNFEVLYSCIRTVCKILSSGDKRLLEEYRDQGGVTVMGYLCNRALAEHFYLIEKQRTMTHLVLIIEMLIRGSIHYRQLYGERVMNLITTFFKRMLKGRPGDSRPDSRLVISVIDLLWEVVIWHPPHLKLFVRTGYCFTLMDIMRRSSFPVSHIILSTLVDLIDQGDCVPHLLTWRDIDTQQGYSAILAEIWREEEKRSGVKRTKKGTIEDIELPLMGEDQWYHTFYQTKDPNMSPATVDIIGSVRPKIYAILQLLKQRHAQKAEISEEYYRINYLPVSVENQVTLQLAVNYFALKAGEVWAEVARDLGTVGIKPIGADGDVIAVLTQRQRQCATCVLEAQKAILATNAEEERKREKQVYSELNEYRLGDALKGMRELDLYACSTEYEFLLTAKQKQQTEIDRLLQFPPTIPENCRHRTSPEKLDTGTVARSETILTSVTVDKHSKQPKVPKKKSAAFAPKKYEPPELALLKMRLAFTHSKSESL